MLYPRDRHGIGRGSRHYHRKMIDFILDNL
jgi:hypothetical protein